MTDKKSNDSRRKLLKSIAAGSGAVVAGKTLPESWSKPIVDSVMLPAHAETTGTPVPESCKHGSLTIVADEVGLDDIIVVYDGATICDIVSGDVNEGTSIPADAVIVIDADPGDELSVRYTWDYSGIGTGWTMIGGDFSTAGDSGNNPNGSYYIDVQRVADPAKKFRVSFRVNIFQDGSDVKMTVDQISITAT